MNSIKILLVDDDEDDYILTRDILQEDPACRHFTLSWCNNYSEAVNAMLKSHYDLYLVDYRLGKDSGLDLLNEAIKSNCTEPIIIFTGKGDAKTDQEAMRLGAADYLVKDKISSQTLERSIRYALEKNKSIKSLKASENKFKIIFERAKEPMVITDPAGEILEANAAALAFFEASLSVLQKLNAKSFYKNQEDRDTYIAMMEANGSIADFELEMVTVKGQSKPCSLSSFLQVSQHANEERFYTIIHDLTSRLQRENERVVSGSLDSAERFALRLSKEIQNSLSSINLAIDELATALKSDDQLALADIIKANCIQINTVTNDLLSLSAKASTFFEKADVQKLVQEEVEYLESEFNVAIPFSGSEEQLEAEVETERFKEAIAILLKNAAEAVAENDGTIEVFVTRKNSVCEISIKDSGAGIPSEDLDKIFEPLFTTKTKAIGLGLTRAQRILKAHKCLLSVSQNQTGGTIATVKLPLACK